MMDCKKALEASDGDMDKAVEFLREKGLAAAQKKAGRIAAEGMAYADMIDGVGVAVEVNAETDFVAKNEKFVEFVNNIAKVIAGKAPASLQELMAATYPGTDLTVTEQLQAMILVIGENIGVRRFARYTSGVTVPYVHGGGRIAVLVNMDVTGIDAEKVLELGKDLAMQIASMRPLYLDASSVSEAELDKEKEIQLNKALEENKAKNLPEDKARKIAENMVKGRINKYYEEICLMNQPYVKENKISVEKHVQQVAKELGGTINVTSFTRFERGEGIEKKQDDLAAEVACMIKE